MPDGKKTTKEILGGAARANTKVALFDRESLKSIKTDLTSWKNTKVSQLDIKIIKAGLQEDADIIGVSSLGGAHLSLGADLVSLAKKENIFASKGFVIGGAIPPDDAKKLLGIGFDATFASWATKDEIVSSVRAIAEKKT